ncbi:MAG TPA: AAA family ATPase [Actinomycetota bacterium]
MNDDVAEFGRTFRTFMDRMNQAVGQDRTSPLREAIDRHLGTDTTQLPVVAETYAGYDHVNVQVAVSAYLAGDERRHELIGLTGSQRHHSTLSDLLETGHWMGVRIGAPDFVNLHSGPEETLACVQFGLFMIHDGQTPIAALMRGADERMDRGGVSLEVLSREQGAARAFLDEIRRLMVELNVFRGQVISFGEARMGHFGAGPVVFFHRPDVSRDQLVLGDGVLELIEQQVLGIADRRDRLRASGQHVKRGLLLHGPPGTGKTHTVRYLLGRATDHTVVLLTGGALPLVRPACGLARLLEPSIVVLEDVDLVAEERHRYPGQSNPFLFDVLNQMDGIEEDADIAFLLTTNRADLLEPALAARPGRVDQAVQIALPDADARRRLIALYGRGLDLRLSDADAVVDRTEGVTASFVKELLRKSALLAAISEDEGGAGSALVVTDEQVTAALDELLSERNELTRVLLGGAPAGRADDEGDGPEPTWAHARPRPRPGTAWLTISDE